jgi:hypothetical protein
MVYFDGSFVFQGRAVSIVTVLFWEIVDTAKTVRVISICVELHVFLRVHHQRSRPVFHGEYEL